LSGRSPFESPHREGPRYGVGWEWPGIPRLPIRTGGLSELDSEPEPRHNRRRKGIVSIPLCRLIVSVGVAARTLEDWVDSLQARGRYTFRRAEANDESGLSAEAVKKALQRLVGRGRVAKVKDYFFVIVPLEYRTAGAPPPSWFLHDLMEAMQLPYYVGLLSAAALHGAVHQQPQEFQVVTDRSVRPLVAGRARIRFFTSKDVVGTAVQSIKTSTGSMRVSTPEATVMDLVRFARAAGSLDNVAAVLSELCPQIDPRHLLRVVRQRDDVPNAQRLGYLLDRLRAKTLAKPIHDWVVRRGPRAVPLRPGRTSRGAVEDQRWHVLVSEPLQVET
jgi:predicted transcriptional regulator of viral defense system